MTNETGLAVRLEAQARRFERDMERATRQLERQARRMERSVQGVDRVAERADGRLSALGGVAGTTAGSLARLAGPVGAGLTVGALTALVDRAITSAASLKRLAASANVPVERFQTLAYAAQQFGVEGDVLEDALRELNLRLGEFAVEGGGPAEAALRDLGLASRIASGELRNSEAVFDAAVDALASVPDPAERAAYAVALFGDEAGMAMPRLVADGVDSLRALEQEARDLGMVLSDETVEGAQDARRKLDTLFRVIEVQGTAAIAEFAPDLAALASDLIDFAVQAGKAGREFAAFLRTLDEDADITAADHAGTAIRRAMYGGEKDQARREARLALEARDRAARQLDASRGRADAGIKVPTFERKLAEAQQRLRAAYDTLAVLDGSEPTASPHGNPAGAPRPPAAADDAPAVPVPTSRPGGGFSSPTAFDLPDDDDDGSGGGGGGSRSARRDPLAGALAGAEERLDVMRREREAIGATAEEADRLAVIYGAADLKRELLSAGQEQGRVLTVEERAEIDRLVATYQRLGLGLVEAEAEQRRMAEAQAEAERRTQDQVRAFARLSESMLSTVTRARSVKEALAGIAVELGNVVAEGLQGEGILGDALGGVVGKLAGGIGSLFGGAGAAPLGYGVGTGGLYAKGGVHAHGRSRPLPRFARGGVSDGAAIFGEAGPEAAVPLPDGRRIPVALSMPKARPGPQAGGGQGALAIHLGEGLRAQWLAEAREQSVAIVDGAMSGPGFEHRVAAAQQQATRNRMGR